MASKVSFCHLVASRPPGRARCAQVPPAPWHRPQEPEPEAVPPPARERPGAHPAAPDLVSQACGKGRPPPRAAEVRGALRAGGGRAGSRPCARARSGSRPRGAFPPGPEGISPPSPEGEHFLRVQGGTSSGPAGPRPGPGRRALPRRGGGARSLRGKGGMPRACALRPLRGACAGVCVCVWPRSERRGGREACAMTSRRRAQDVTPA